MPDINKIYIPKRVSAELRKIYSETVTVVCAPDGTGKSTTLREYIAHSRPKDVSVRFITESESTGSCFSQISSVITGKPYSEPLTDSELTVLRERFRNASPEKPLILVVDCAHAIDTLLGNYRTARLLSECSCARFVFVCSFLRQAYHQMAELLGFHLIERGQIALTAEETAEYAASCGISVNIGDVYLVSGGSFLRTRLCFMLAAQGRDFTGCTSGSQLVRALLETQSPRLTGAATIASAFNDISQATCAKLGAFTSITEHFGADLLNSDAITTELKNLRSLIPLVEINCRRKTVKLHPVLRQALYTLFFRFPDHVQHDMRIFFGREYLRTGKNYYAFCEFFLAGEFELAAGVHYNEPVNYYMLKKSSRLLQRFVLECPLTCKPALPRLLRVISLLMHTNLRPTLTGRFREIIDWISHSPDLSGAERRSLLSYAYALRTNESLYVLDKMGDNIKRAYDMFRGRREYEAPPFPWAMYSPSVFFLLHRRGYSIHTETAQFTRYQHMYTEMLDHGRYTDIIFSGEAKYCQGDIPGALELFSAAASLCTGVKDLDTKLCAMYNAAKCCLYLGEYTQFFEFVNGILRIERSKFSREEGDCARLYLGLLRALRGGGAEDMWYALSAEDSEPLRSHITDPYFAVIRAVYYVLREKYDTLEVLAAHYIELAAEAGNEGAGITLRLLSAQALLSLGSHERAVQYACEAFNSVLENDIPAVAAEVYPICPDLFEQVKPLNPVRLHPVIDEAIRLGKEFQRGVETVRSYEMTYLSNIDQDNHAEHYVEPIRRLAASSAERRKKLGLSEQAFIYAIMAASGVSNSEISGLLGVTENSVKSSLKRTFAQLGIKNRRELIGIVPVLRS